MQLSSVESEAMSQLATADALPDFAPQLFAAEDRHFWFRARNTVIGRVVRQLVAGLKPGYRVLEVGCGNGNVLRVLEQICSRGEVIGLDSVEEKLHFARQRTDCALRLGNLYDLPAEGDQPFDVIGLFDVLEHLPDEDLALRALSHALAPGGRLVLTVPAHQSLWSYADSHAGHYRRYSVAQLKQVLAASGLRVEYCTQFMTVLFPIMWLGRRLATLRQKPGRQGERELFQRELCVVPIVNGLLTRLLELEAPLIGGRWRLPLGASLLAIAVKD
jgi:SAM-dependent methyltransferase